jgi:hypothetical protein
MKIRDLADDESDIEVIAGEVPDTVEVAIHNANTWTVATVNIHDLTAALLATRQPALVPA